MNYYTKIGDLNTEFQGRGQWIAKTTYYGKTLATRIYAGEMDEMARQRYDFNRYTLAKKIIKNMRFEARMNNANYIR